MYLFVCNVSLFSKTVISCLSICQFVDKCNAFTVWNVFIYIYITFINNTIVYICLYIFVIHIFLSNLFALCHYFSENVRLFLLLYLSTIPIYPSFNCLFCCYFHYIYIYIYVCACVRACMRVCMCVCLFLPYSLLCVHLDGLNAKHKFRVSYIYIYIYIYIHMMCVSFLL